MKIFFNLFVIISFFFLFSNDSIGSQKIKILYKINNSIITNIDIQNETSYLVSLNKNLREVSQDEKIKIAKDSLIREIIKTDEIKKFFVIEKYENKDLMDSILKNFYTNLNLNNISEFKEHLKSFGFSINDIKKKIKIEILWNQLISRKFSNQININENAIRQNVINEKMNYKDIIEYELSEIVFSPKDNQEFTQILEKINNTINQNGFKTAANKFSISDTAKFGGSIGKVKENQLSKKIRDELKVIETQQYTKPILINNNYLIIRIDQKKIINEKFDENKVVKEIINLEKKRQYQNFSQIYFNKIKLNAQINEF